MKNIILILIIALTFVFTGCSSDGDPEIDNIVQEIISENENTQVISDNQEIQPATDIEELNKTNIEEEKEEAIGEG